MKRFKKFAPCLTVLLLLTAFLAFTGRPVFAVVTEATTPDADTIREINKMTPGSDKTFLGNRLRGTLVRETSSVTSSGSVDIDVDDAVVRFTTNGAGSGGTFDSTLANGYSGQLMTFVLVTDGGSNVDLTPVTKTGFTSITLSDAGDSATIRYVDDTIGWVIAGNNAATINQ